MPTVPRVSYQHIEDSILICSIYYLLSTMRPKSFQVADAVLIVAHLDDVNAGLLAVLLERVRVTRPDVRVSRRGVNISLLIFLRQC